MNASTSRAIDFSQMPLENFTVTRLVSECGEDDRAAFLAALCVFQMGPEKGRHEVSFTARLRALWTALSGGRATLFTDQSVALFEHYAATEYLQIPEVSEWPDFDRIITKMLRAISSTGEPSCFFVRCDSEGCYRNLDDGRVYRIDRRSMSIDQTRSLWMNNLFIWGRPLRFYPQKGKPEMRIIHFPGAIGGTEEFRSFSVSAAYVSESTHYDFEKKAVVRTLWLPKIIGGRALNHSIKAFDQSAVGEMFITALIECMMTGAIPEAVRKVYAEHAANLEQSAAHVIASQRLFCGAGPWDRDSLRSWLQTQLGIALCLDDIKPEQLLLPGLTLQQLMDSGFEPRRLARSSVYSSGLRYNAEEFQLRWDLHKAEEEAKLQQATRLNALNGSTHRHLFADEAQVRSFCMELNQLLESHPLQIAGAPRCLPTCEESLIPNLVATHLLLWSDAEGQITFDEASSDRRETTNVAMALVGPPPRWTRANEVYLGEQRAQRVWLAPIGDWHLEVLVYQSSGSLNMALRILS